MSYLFESSILLYTFVLILIYIVLVISALIGLTRYHKQQEINNAYLLLNSPLQPPVSIIASCYNESASVKDCVGALMRLEYDNYEVIVVNDGSKDNTLGILIHEYDLFLTDETVSNLFNVNEVCGVYRSLSKAWYNLVVINKVNGGKADAMNAGIAFSSGEYIMNIDVDSILVPDALIKLMIPILRADDVPVVAVGGSIGIANGCAIKNGMITNKRVPRNYLASIQVVEYARTFLLGRMGWAGLNSLLLVSGALGIFRKDLIIEVGGYKKGSMGEDIELIAKIRRRLYEKKIKHKIEYVPDTLLWTEVPSSLTTLYRQRVRWTKGLISVLISNRKVIFNPAYGRMGLITYPYWLLYEWMAPFVEVIGTIYLGYNLLMGHIDWLFFGYLTLFMFLFGGVFSVISILIEQVLIHSYDKKRDVLKLFARGITELLFYHPFVSICAIIGNIQYVLRNDHTWGDMKHKGFSSTN